MDRNDRPKRNWALGWSRAAALRQQFDAAAKVGLVRRVELDLNHGRTCDARHSHEAAVFGDVDLGRSAEDTAPHATRHRCATSRKPVAVRRRPGWSAFGASQTPDSRHRVVGGTVKGLQPPGSEPILELTMKRTLEQIPSVARHQPLTIVCS
jgi:hypothetical protein